MLSESPEGPEESHQHILLELVEFLEPVKSLTNVKLATFITEDIWKSSLTVLSGEIHRDATALAASVSWLADDRLSVLYRALWDFCVLLQNLPRDTPLERYPEASNPLEKLARQAFWKCRLIVRMRGPVVGDGAVAGLDGRMASLLMMSGKKLREVEAMAPLAGRQAMAPLAGRLAAQCALRRVVDVGCGKGYLSAWLSLRYNLDVLGMETAPSTVQAAETRLRRLSKQWSAIRQRVAASSPSPPGTLRFTHQTITGDTRWPEEEAPFLLCGLHTCGALSDHMIDIFVSCAPARGLLVVPCCYHLMEERYDMPDSSATAPGLFPSSSLLQRRNCSLGRNARMLASQSVERTLADRGALERSVRALFFRALLQLVVKSCGLEEVMGSVGRRDAVDTDFVTYVRDALARQNLSDRLTLTDEQLTAISTDDECTEARLRIFCLVRIVLAPVIEQITLLDRLCALHEQEDIAVVRAVDLFDPVISPRRWAIAATKKPFKD